MSDRVLQWAVVITMAAINFGFFWSIGLPWWIASIIALQTALMLLFIMGAGELNARFDGEE